MEDIVAYVLLLVFGAGAVYLYYGRKAMVKEFPLSVQTYSGSALKVLLQKQHGKIRYITLTLVAGKELQVKNISVELIDAKREFSELNLNREIETLKLPAIINRDQAFSLQLPYDDFRDQLLMPGNKFRTFRFVVETDGNKKFKSHELAFNRSMTIYRPDSGRYN